MGTVSTPAAAPVRWHDSLIVRMVGLSVILVACLFGAVYFLTGHYYKQVVTTMERQAEAIAQAVKVQLDTLPEPPVDIERAPEQIEMPAEHVDLRPLTTEVTQPSGLTPQIGEEGNMYFIATQTFQLKDGRWVEMTIQMPIVPQTELIRAFKNRFLLGLTCVFLMTLAAMVYLIAQSLRPLQVLADTCAKVSAGSLETIDVSHGPGEVRALGATFNQMVGALREKAIVEANLRRAQRLSAIGNLAAGVAHDVRNPLNAIKLLSSQALDEAEAETGTGTGNGTVKALRTIRSEVDRLEDIVSGFLSLAKEEELRKEVQALDPVLMECINLIQKDAESRDVRVFAELRTGDVQLPIDAKKLKRAVLNVLINGLEVCPPGGRIRLFSRVTPDACEVEIRDDGPGMTPEALEHAFDPYYTTKPTGTGLGLSITRGIIEEHGGTIALSSTIGHGTQVLITLPMQSRLRAGGESVPARAGH
jgi:signal transduction histidine kinase